MSRLSIAMLLLPAILATALYAAEPQPRLQPDAFLSLEAAPARAARAAPLAPEQRRRFAAVGAAIIYGLEWSRR